MRHDLTTYYDRHTYYKSRNFQILAPWLRSIAIFGALFKSVRFCAPCRFFRVMYRQDDTKNISKPEFNWVQLILLLPVSVGHTTRRPAAVSALATWARLQRCVTQRSSICINEPVVVISELSHVGVLICFSDVFMWITSVCAKSLSSRGVLSRALEQAEGGRNLL